MTYDLVIFLDFDGVLHGSSTPFFHSVPLIETLVERLNAYVVFSTDWRESQSLEQLKSYFSESFRKRVIGTTPVLDLDVHRRYNECLAFLAEIRCKQWLVIDDRGDLFPSSANLYLTDCNTGFDEKDTEKIFSLFCLQKRDF